MPSRSRYSTAAASPITWAVIGTPASKRCGGGMNVLPSIRTTSIIEPPVRNGGSASRTSYRPQRTPTPVGPSILCPEKTRKSAPSSVTSTGWCGTDWAPSTSTRAPTSRARATIGASGLIVPRMLDCWVTATSLVRSLTTLFGGGEVQPPVVGEAEPAQGRPGALAQLLPRHEVAVVLHLGHHDLVALTHGVPAERVLLRRGGVGERVGHEVDALGGVAGEDDLAVVLGPDEAGDLGPGRLVEVGRLLGQLVRAAVHGGVVVLVEVPLGVEDGARLLRGRPGVEVDQLLPVAHGAGQNREVGPDRLGVPREGLLLRPASGTRDGLGHAFAVSFESATYA